MGEVELIKLLAEHGGILGLLLAVSVVLIGLYFKYRVESIPPAKSPTKELMQVKQVDDRLAAIDRRLTAVEGVVDHLPTREEFHAVDLTMVQMRTKMEAIEETTARTGRSVTRIEDFLLSLGAPK